MKLFPNAHFLCNSNDDKNKKAKPNAHTSLLDFPCQKNCDSFCVQFSSCKTWFHYFCSNLPNSILAVLGKIKGISWSCENCEQKGQLPLTKADTDSLSDNIQSLNTQIQQELSEIRNDINQLKQNSCEAKIEQLQNEIKDLKSSVGSLKKNSQAKSQYKQQSENNMSDKLIIVGIQENQDQISRIEAMNADKKQVVSTFEQIVGLKM